MIDPQTYLDIAQYNVDPMVFEFDAMPNNITDMYAGMGIKIDGLSRRPVAPISNIPFLKSQEEIDKEEQERIAAEKARIEAERNDWCKEFANNHYTTDLYYIFGDLTKQQLKWIKKILDTDEDCTYIYAGNKDRTEFLALSDVCAHVVKSKIKNGKLQCEIEFDYTDPGLRLYKNLQRGFKPKLNLNTIFVYDEKIPNMQNMKFLCLEFI